MTVVAAFLNNLAKAADKAAAAEKQYRQEASASIRRLERERAFAYRRLNLLRAVADAMKNAENLEAAVDCALAILRSKLGWSDVDSDATSAVCTHFAPVARVIFTTFEPAEEPGDSDLAGALAAFEAWYSSTHPEPFWVLFEQHMVETPRVDF
jgi:hypothetical protein